MSSKSLSTIHWEVWTIFEWGTVVKTTYKTREKAREGMRISKESSKYNGEIPKYYSWKLYKVKHLGGLSQMSGNGVYVYEEKR